ncbi:YgjV family protein [Photobacterium sanctipauli]|uniref:YgjV family protein n=1 Tax=Photobacterium sanctipauli TaxID=1342794 RepID=A0A2T3NX78_9GAMM|nr:YgjV family protein [Photobacterium sanctipauli]PSW20841.1 YgjV family protein [Photobacterium sanctipauli]
MLEFSFAQALGMVSFALGVAAFYQKNDRKLKLMMVLLNVNHMVHFFLLGAVTSAMSAMLSAFRTGLSIKYQSKALAYIFVAFNLAAGYWLAEGWVDLLPIMGACIGSYALFCLSGIQMRLAFVVGAICWLINNVIVGSVGGVLLELTLLSVNLTTIYRLYRSKATVEAEAS